MRRRIKRAEYNILCHSLASKQIRSHYRESQNHWCTLKRTQFITDQEKTAGQSPVTLSYYIFTFHILVFKIFILLPLFMLVVLILVSVSMYIFLDSIFVAFFSPICYAHKFMTGKQRQLLWQALFSLAFTTFNISWLNFGIYSYECYFYVQKPECIFYVLNFPKQWCFGEASFSGLLVIFEICCVPI